MSEQTSKILEGYKRTIVKVQIVQNGTELFKFVQSGFKKVKMVYNVWKHCKMFQNYDTLGPTNILNDQIKYYLPRINDHAVSNK